MNYSDVNVEEILNYYGVNNITVDGDEVKFSCPFPEHSNGDRNPSSGINTKTGMYNCFSCHRGGTLVNFIAEMEGVTEGIAIRYIRENFYDNKEGAYFNLSDYVNEALSVKEPNYEQGPLPEMILDNFFVDWIAVENKIDTAPEVLTSVMKDKGFDASTMIEYGLGFDNNTERITIPVRNSKGELVGIKGRATRPGQMPKYKSIGDKRDNLSVFYGFYTTNINKYVYGLDTAEGDELIIVEGEFDAISLRNKGFKGAVALGTSSIRPEQARDIRRRAKSVVILLDNDVAGNKGAISVYDLISPFIPAIIGECLENLDPAEMTKEQIQKAINQAQDIKLINKEG